jgi:hypothetical protein
MKRISGEILSKYKPEDLFEFLRKPSTLVQCIPGVINYEVIDDNNIKIKARLDISDAGIPEMRSITSTFMLSLISLEKERARYRINGKAAGSSYDADLEIFIEPYNDGSKIKWNADISLSKLLQILDRFIGIEEIARRIANLALEGVERCASR